jgi:hypothetical protein
MASMPGCRGYVSALTDAAKVVTEQAAQIARRRIFTNFLDVTPLWINRC